jgi:hypothetical protein
MADTAAALRDLELSRRDLPRGLQELDTRSRGTGGAAVVRGYRLLLAQRALARADRTPLDDLEITVLLTPLRQPEFMLANGQDPLRFYETDADRLRAADRWVMLGWLDEPTLPLKAVAEALQAPAFDALRSRPVGRLVLARAAGASGDPTAGLIDLGLATALALQRAAADRDQEQGAWADRQRSLAAELGDPDPIAFLLRRALTALTDAAGDDQALAAALLAHEALRWMNDCEDAPCVGVDRTSGMSATLAVHAGVTPLVRTWRVIALKEAVDGFEVAQNTIRMPAATIDLVDALAGTGAAPPDANLLARRQPDPGFWNTLGATVGLDQATGWSEVREGLGRQLAQEARSAAEVTDSTTASVLVRVARRATP